MFNVKESEYGKQPFHLSCHCCWGCPDGSGSKESACNAGDQGSTPGSGRSLEKEMVTHSSCLVAKLCLDLCSPKDCSPPGSSVHEIFQARILEWVAISFSRRSSKPRDQTHISCVGKGVLYCWTNMETSFIWVDNFN